MNYAVAYIFFFNNEAYANFDGAEGHRDFSVSNPGDVPKKNTLEEHLRAC